MGQKIHPTGFRLSILKNWSSKWYANKKNFAAMLNEDIKVREYLKKKLASRISRSCCYRKAIQECADNYFQLSSWGGNRQER